MPQLSAKDKAEIRKLEAEARKAEAEARQSELTAVIPDLSKVVVPELATHEATTVGHSRLTFGGLQELGRKVAERVRKTGAKRVLITTDKDLASTDAIYRDVDSGLTSLKQAADAVLIATKPKPSDQESLGAALAVASVAASVLPHAISLLLPRRSVATGTLAVDDLGACAALMSHLIRAKVEVVDAGFRTLANDEFYRTVGQLDQSRRDLVERKLELSVGTGDDDNAEAIESVDAVITSIDAFLTAIRATGSDGGPSRLATAAIAHAIHQKDGGIDHVVLVKGQSGSVTELREDKKFAADIYTAIADVSVTFMVLESTSGRLVDADNITVTLVATGKIGEIPSVKPVAT